MNDAMRWDERYRNYARYDTYERPRPFLVEHAHLLPSTGLALDAAMGLGGNAGFLLERGLRVVGLDISGVALRRARNRLPGLMAVQSDLNFPPLQSSNFDVILNFFYLQRELWPFYLRSLRPGGYLMIETLTMDMLERQPEINPQFLLQPGELIEVFSSLTLLTYREGWTESEQGHPRATAALLARKD